MEEEASAPITRKNTGDSESVKTKAADAAAVSGKELSGSADLKNTRKAVRKNTSAHRRAKAKPDSSEKTELEEERKTVEKEKASKEKNMLVKKSTETAAKSDSSKKRLENVKSNSTKKKSAPLTERTSREAVTFAPEPDMQKSSVLSGDFTDAKPGIGLENKAVLGKQKVKRNLLKNLTRIFQIFSNKKKKAQKQISVEHHSEIIDTVLQEQPEAKLSTQDQTIFVQDAIDQYKGTHESTTLQVKDLHKYFGRKKAVRGVSFSISSGEIVGFLGPNGAGKTTVFYMIVGFIRPTEGKILFNNTEINKLAMHRRAKLGISYLPQEPSVFRRLTVEKNILAILETLPHLNRNQRKERLEILLRDFGLMEIRKQKAYTLSGGERRRTEIARGMALKPRFLLLDEPFTGIDPKARYELKLIISALAKRGVGILITDHNEHDTLSITNRAFILYRGEIVVTGTRAEIMKDVKAREIYLGENYEAQH